MYLEVSERISNLEHFLWVKKMFKVEELCCFGIAENRLVRSIKTWKKDTKNVFLMLGISCILCISLDLLIGFTI